MYKEGIKYFCAKSRNLVTRVYLVFYIMHLTQLNCEWETSTYVHHRIVWFCNTFCYWRKLKIFLLSPATIIHLSQVTGQEVPLKVCEVSFLYHLLWKPWVLSKSMLVFHVIGSCDCICSSHNQLLM